MKNVVLVYREFRNISNIGEALTKFGENIFLTTNLSNGIQLIEDDINITVSDGNISAVGKISELSLEEISAIFVDIPVFAHDDKLSISFSLNIRREIHNIVDESSIIETESGRDLSYIDLKLLTSPDENMKISDYLSGKQMQFIRELKNISQN